jgi:hypothetical protein
MITDARRSRRFMGLGMDMGSRDPLAQLEEGLMSWSRTISRSDLTPTEVVRGDEAPLWRLLGDFYGALTRDDPIAQRYLLLLRFILANVLALALLGAAAGQGWVGALLAADQGGMCRAIVAVFLVGLVWSAQRALELSRALNAIKRLQACHEAPVPEYLRLGEGRDAQSRTLPIRQIANSLVLLGLIGTVIGFIIALAGVRPDVVSDVNSIGPMVSTLISGMSVALYTTLVGSLLNLWLMVNVRLLEGGTVKLLTATVELGERHAGS